MVDTGATIVSLTRLDAIRASAPGVADNLNYPVMMSTANGNPKPRA